MIAKITIPNLATLMVFFSDRNVTFFLRSVAVSEPMAQKAESNVDVNPEKAIKANKTKAHFGRK